MAQNKGRTAWLITWETTGEHIKNEKTGSEKYAALLNPHWEPNIVCCIMGSLWRYEDKDEGLNDWLKESLDYAKISSDLTNSTRKNALNFRLAVRNDDGSYECGSDDLYLKARKVKNLRIITDAQRGETLAWEDWKYKKPRSKKESEARPPATSILKMYGDKVKERSEKHKQG